MSWLLVDAVAGRLQRQKRHQVFVAIGCREYLSVIVLLLEGAAKAGLRLPANVLRSLGECLDGYVGAPEEAQIRVLVSQAHVTTGDLYGSEQSDRCVSRTSSARLIP